MSLNQKDLGLVAEDTFVGHLRLEALDVARSLDFKSRAAFDFRTS